MATSTQANLDQLLAHIAVVVRSTTLAGYLVGITRDVAGRKKSYVQEGFPFFFVLQAGLRADEAADIEQSLFSALTSNRRATEYKKYQSPKRDKGYRRSVGKSPGTEANFVFYLAAWRKDAGAHPQNRASTYSRPSSVHCVV